MTNNLSGVKLPKYKIGTIFKTRHKVPRLCTVVDIYKTYNDRNELVMVRYVCTHEFLGQTITDQDVVETTIALGFISEPVGDGFSMNDVPF